MRNALRRGGINASVGRYAFGFTWGAWAAITIASFLLCAGVGRKKENRTSSAIGDDHVTTTRKSNMSNNVGFFRRQRSARSARGSFVDNESQRRVVKDEY